MELPIFRWRELDYETLSETDAGASLYKKSAGFCSVSVQWAVVPDGKLISGSAAFAAFCMVSSVVYSINDIRDKEKDKKHPVKCNRPIAAGTVSVKQAVILVVILLIMAAFFQSRICCAASTGWLVLYLLLNLVYSFGLKNIPMVDVTILAAGFLLRILYGALATGIAVSGWLYLTVMAAAFYFVLGKRRNELKQLGSGETRKVLGGYPAVFLEQNMGMCLVLVNVFYALWSMDERTGTFYNNKYLVFTVPMVLLITMKYSLDIAGKSDGDPVEVLLHDKALFLMCVLYGAVMLVILYGGYKG